MWPLNPNGELVLGVKLEDQYALANAKASLETPGIAFAGWGPGDTQLSLGVSGQEAPEMRAARNPVFSATEAHTILFLESMNPNNVVAEINKGVRIGPANQQATENGRQFTNRQLPW